MQFLEDGTHNILLAIDFSQPSKRAFDAAARLARVFGATLHLLHVNEEESLFGQHSSDELTHFMDDIVRRRSDWMQGFEASAQDNGIDADVIMREGDPAATILEVATEVHAGCIVMGTQGARGLGSVLPGSVARKVLRKAERPVLVVSRMAGVAPHESGGTFEHVVYPTDFSPASRSGLRMAELFVERTKARLTLLHVIKLPRVIPVLPGEQPIVIPNRAADHLREDLEVQMDELTAHVSTEVSSAVTVSASPDQGIAEFVSQAGVDLIIIPRHSQHQMSHYVFGHTAEHLMKISPVPVLLFNPRMS